jgi:O-antigen/teichoic acid export membrane protein
MNEAPRRRASIELISGQVIGQLSLIVVIPLLTRQFDPAEFGWFQLAMAVALVLQPVATLRAEFVIPTFENEQSARRLYFLALCSTLGLACASGSAALVALLAGDVDQSVLWVMTGILLVAAAWTVVDNSRLIRAQRTRPLAIRNALAGLLAAGLQVIVALVGWGIVGLALALLFGRIIAIALTWVPRVSPVNSAPALPERNPYTVRRAGLSISSGLAASASAQTITLATGAMLGAQESAYVSVAQRMAGAPLTLLGQGLGQALQSRVAPAIRQRTGNVVALLRRQVLTLSVVAVGAATAIAILAPALAEPVLGKGWQPAGVVTAVLAPALALQLLTGPLMPVLPMLGKESLLFATQVLRLGLVVVATVWAGISTASMIGMAIAYSAASVAGYMLMLLVVMRAARAFDSESS